MISSSTESEIVLENEWYAVRHSGEIPEIALCSALYYLVEDSSGPCLELSAAQYLKLVEAAELRFREIVLRDLLHANRGKRIYRGVKRTIVNWYRYENFCSRQKVDLTAFRHEVAAALLAFLTEGMVSAKRGRGDLLINCTFDELCTFAVRIGLSDSLLPDSVANICLKPE